MTHEPTTSAHDATRTDTPQRLDFIAAALFEGDFIRALRLARLEMQTVTAAERQTRVQP